MVRKKDLLALIAEHESRLDAMEVFLSKATNSMMEMLEMIIKATNVEKVNHVKIKTKQGRATKVKVSCSKQKRGRGRPRKEV